MLLLVCINFLKCINIHLHCIMYMLLITLICFRILKDDFVLKKPTPKPADAVVRSLPADRQVITDD